MINVRTIIIVIIVITLAFVFLKGSENAEPKKSTFSKITKSGAPKEHSNEKKASLTKSNSSDKSALFEFDSIEMQYRSASDLYALALELLGKSEAGDAESQFYLVKVLLECQAALPLKNRLINERETILQRELVESLTTKCAHFNKENITKFGKIEEWVSLSAKSEYGPSVLLSELFSPPFEETPETLLVIKKALISNHPDVMLMMSSLSKSQTSKKAWNLIACHYGSDCSKESRSDWRYRMAAQCALNYEQTDSCINGADYRTFVRESSTPEEYRQILIEEQRIKKLLDEKNHDHLTFEELLN